MNLSDLVPRVQAKLDDEEGTYITPDYILAHAEQAYEELYNRMVSQGAGAQFDNERVVLPAVAPTPDLSAFMVPGQPLASMVTPYLIEWKLAGLDDVNYLASAGPLDAPRDMPQGTINLDSWSWIRRQLLLSKFIQALDLRITGKFLFDPLTSVDSSIQIAINANTALVYLICEAIGDARGNDKWSLKYGKKAESAIDDIVIPMVRGDQGKTHRLARMSRRSSPTAPLNIPKNF